LQEIWNEVIFLTTYIFPHVLNALMKREGQEVTLPTLTSLTGFDERQIQNAIANARRNDEDHAARIEVVKLGRSWKFNANAGSNGEVTVEGILEDVEMGSPHIWKHVLAAIATRPNEVMTREEIAAIVNKSSEFTLIPEQVSTAMMTILRRPLIGPTIEIIQAARAWRYKPVRGAKAEVKHDDKQASEMKVSTSIRASVLRYFTLKPGQPHFASDIANDLGFTTKQVQNSMYNILFGEPKSVVANDFVVVQAGHAWQYTPNRGKTNGVVPDTHASTITVDAPAAPHEAVGTTLPVSSSVPNITPSATTKRTFTELMTTSQGTIIIQDPEGTLYRASELDLD
jgi:hypothetical protein